MGINPIVHKSHKLEIRELWKKGLSKKEMMSITGLHPQTIAKHILEYDNHDKSWVPPEKINDRSRQLKAGVVRLAMKVGITITVLARMYKSARSTIYHLGQLDPVGYPALPVILKHRVLDITNKYAHKGEYTLHNTSGENVILKNSQTGQVHEVKAVSLAGRIKLNDEKI